MSLASLVDIKRILHMSASDTSIDTELTASLQAAEAWVETVTGRNFDATGSVTESFYAVRPGDIVVVGDYTPTVTSVKTYMGGSLVGSTQTEGSGYHVMDKGRVRTSRIGYSGPYGGLRPEEQGIGALGVYDRVDVIYTASGVVPVLIREAVALIAASFYQTSNTEIDAGMMSERMGDYSYSRLAVSGAAALDHIPKRARQLLSFYIKSQARSV